MQEILLEIEMSNKNGEIQILEGRFQAFTSLALASLPVAEPTALSFPHFLY